MLHLKMNLVDLDDRHPQDAWADCPGADVLPNALDASDKNRRMQDCLEV
jgi:hypothetical protein